VTATVSPSPSSAPSPAVARDEAAILAACRDNLARYKVPARLVKLYAFPTTESPNEDPARQAAGDEALKSIGKKLLK
jgi:hypothetical protein